MQQNTNQIIKTEIREIEITESDIKSSHCVTGNLIFRVMCWLFFYSFTMGSASWMISRPL